MPQMAIVQPVTPQGPPQTRTSGTPGRKEQDTFSPHLDQATAKNKKQPTAQDENRTLMSVKTDKESVPEDGAQLAQPQAPDDKLDIAAAGDVAEKADTQSQVIEPGNNFNEMLITASDVKNLPSITASTASSQLPQVEPPVQQSMNTAIGSPGKTIVPESILAAHPPTIVETPIDSAIKPTAAKQQSAIIDQLQRIIDQADEIGTVSIKKAADLITVNSIRSNIQGLLPTLPEGKPAQVLTPITTSTNVAAVNSSLVTDADGAETAVAHTPRQITGSRQEAQQQYFNPKIAEKNLSDTKQNFQDHQQGDELPQQSQKPQQTIGTGAQNSTSSGLSSSLEQTNTFSQIVTTPQQATSQPTSETAKPIFLPSGTIVHEEEILQQLSHKLQISSKHMDSRINLRLHPAELGSLKIDLTVKEGSIRANVVAQSQYTTEILEKNMAKLKTVLENQGFTVDEITITAESESVNDFNLFDQQLFSHSDYTPKAQKERREEETVFTLPDHNNFAAPAHSTGVNVKI